MDDEKKMFDKIETPFTDEMRFENHLCAKVEVLYAKAYELIKEASSYEIDPEPGDRFNDSLYDAAIIGPVLETLESTLATLNVPMCYPYYTSPTDENGMPIDINTETPCYQTGLCKMENCPLKKEFESRENNKTYNGEE